MKDSRWYTIENGLAYIYDSGYAKDSLSASIVPVSDLAYYRRNFRLAKVWD